MPERMYIRQQVRHAEPKCAICNEPVNIQTAQTDEDGHAVHEDCYLDWISGKIPLKTKKPPATHG